MKQRPKISELAVGFCSQDDLLAAVARVAPARLVEPASRAIGQGYSIARAES